MGCQMSAALADLGRLRLEYSVSGGVSLMWAADMSDPVDYRRGFRHRVLVVNFLSCSACRFLRGTILWKI